MTNSTSNKLTRRDAIKILGAAAGAAILANLPSKWSTPELTSGVLPAHAQTSGLHTLSCDADLNVTTCQLWHASWVTISPPDSGVPMQFSVSVDLPADLTSPIPSSGISPTANLGRASIAPFVNIPNATIHITWSFANPSQGSGSCTQNITLNCPTPP